MRVVDIDLSSFRIPPPPFWRGRYAPLVGFFGVLFLGLALAWAGGRAGAILGFLLMALVVLAAFASMFWTVPRMWRDRSRSSVTGERLPFARPEDLARTPQGASRPLGEMVESMRRLEEGAPAPEVVARPVP